jgi:hypothetical protein
LPEVLALLDHLAEELAAEYLRLLSGDRERDDGRVQLCRDEVKR